MSLKHSTIEHAAVKWQDWTKRDGVIFVIVRCPLCGRERYVQAKVIRHFIRAGSFTGHCQECAAFGKHREQ